LFYNGYQPPTNNTHPLFSEVPCLLLIEFSIPSVSLLISILSQKPSSHNTISEGTNWNSSLVWVGLFNIKNPRLCYYAGVGEIELSSGKGDLTVFGITYLTV